MSKSQRARHGQIAVGAIALLLGVPSGCNTLPTSKEKPGECGIGLAIWLREPRSAQYQYFTIDQGTFSYGAGLAALDLKTYWKTSLSLEQCGSIHAIAESAGWFSANPPNTPPEERGPVADIAVAWADGRQQFVVNGTDASVKEMTDFLANIAAARFRPELDRLPEAGKQAR